MARTEIKIYARISYAFGLFDPQPKASGNGEHYTCTLLIPKSDKETLQKLKQIAGECAIEEWKERAADFVKNGLLKDPILDGDGPQGCNKETGARHKGLEGHVFIRPASGLDYPPVVVKRDGRTRATKADLPSGSWGYAVLSCFPWENQQGGKGVSFNISGFQIAKVAEGDDVLGGAGQINPEKYFEPIADEGDAPAETKDGSGAAGLFG